MTHELKKTKSEASLNSLLCTKNNPKGRMVKGNYGLTTGRDRERERQRETLWKTGRSEAG